MAPKKKKEEKFPKYPGMKYKANTVPKNTGIPGFCKNTVPYRTGMKFLIPLGPVEDTFKNAQWGKVKQMQPM